MKNLSSLILKRFFLDLAFLYKAKQGISHSISIFLTIIDLKVISRKFLGLVNLTKAQALSIHKLTGVILVNKDKNVVFGIFQV